MLVIRQSNLNDVDALLDLAKQTGDGMTTMPQDRDSWVEKIT